MLPKTRMSMFAVTIRSPLTAVFAVAGSTAGAGSMASTAGTLAGLAVTGEGIMAARLKPCPFCGQDCAEFVSNGIGDFYIACGSGLEDSLGCGARTDDRNCESKEHAAERWNRRFRPRRKK